MPPSCIKLEVSWDHQNRGNGKSFAFQTFTETPATTPTILGLGITHQPHGSGDGAKFADTHRVIKTTA